jgi:hypothetical protein
MIAMNYAYRDALERAFDWLERAYKAKDLYLVEFLSEPFFMAKHLRYKAFLRKMNLLPE